MSDREHAQAALRSDCRRRGLTVFLGIPIETIIETWPAKELTLLRRALPAPAAAAAVVKEK